MGVVTLPLYQALTIDVGFPLKLPELAMGLCLTARVLRGRVLSERRITRSEVAAGLLVVSAVVSLAVAMTRPHDYQYSSAASGATELGYLIFDVLAFGAATSFIKAHGAVFVRLWVKGATVAAVYALYMAASSAAGVAVPLLPGTALQAIDVGGVAILRAGSFLEGNYLGTYLLASLALALSGPRRRTALVISLGILASFSTVAIILAGVLWMGAVRAPRRSNLHRIPIAVGVVVVTLALAALSSEVTEAVGGKLRDPRSTSSVERLALIRAGTSMFAEAPLTGVGVAQFGNHLKEHRPSDIPTNSLARPYRVIPNNVYIQIASELGLLGLISFALLLLCLGTRVRRGSPIHRLGFGCVLLSLMAFPTFLALFLWLYFAAVWGCGYLDGSNVPPAVGAAAAGPRGRPGVTGAPQA